MSKKAIIIGASSGIGFELAKILSREGYELGLAARRIELLQELKQQLLGKVWLAKFDLRQVAEARGSLQKMLTEMGEVDLVVLASAVNFTGSGYVWENEAETIAVNVAGFVAMAELALKHFIQQKRGHLVGISSIAALMGNRSAGL